MTYAERKAVEVWIKQASAEGLTLAQYAQRLQERVALQRISLTVLRSRQQLAREIWC